MSDVIEPNKSSGLKDGTYDALKFIALVGLPAFATAYFCIAQLVDLASAEAVVGLAISLDLLLGVLIWASGKRYNSTTKPDNGDYAGVMAVTGYDEVTGHPSLELTIDPTKIIGNDQVVFKVDTRTDQVPPVLPAFDAPDVDFER